MNTYEKMLFLKTTPLFKQVADEALLEVSAAVNERIVKAGELIIRKGDYGTTMYIIVAGKVKVHDGEQLLAELGDHEFFGELAALSPEKRNASVTALEETSLLEITDTTIYDLMETHVAIAKGIIQVLCQRIRTISNDLKRALSR